MEVKANASDIARNIKLIIFDVDGTLTDGRIYMGPSGEAMKAFSVRDGMGIALWHRAGLKSAIITGRSSDIVTRRANELKISAVYQGCIDKRVAYEALKEKYALQDEEIAYVGDDLNDLPLIMTAGLGCGVGDAMPEVRQYVKLLAEKPGGGGAVREIIEFILKQQDKWPSLVESFTAKTRVEDLAQ